MTFPLLLDFKNMLKKDIESFNKIDEKNLWQLNAWFGSDKRNMSLFLDIEEGILNGVPNKILLMEMFLRVKKDNKYIPYPKKIKREDDFEWLKDYFKIRYRWSDREIKIYWSLLCNYLSSQEFKIKVARKFGLTDKERERLGIEKITVEKDSLKNRGQVSLF